MGQCHPVAVENPGHWNVSLKEQNRGGQRNVQIFLYDARKGSVYKCSIVAGADHSNC